MATRLIGAPVKRREDPRLLTGRGRFVDDIHLPGLLHAVMLRSPHAHAHVRRLDASAARRLAGVALVLTADDLGPVGGRTPLLIPHEALTHGLTQYPLARETVNYVGEAVAFVVAVDRATAEDAADSIKVEYEPLTPVVDLAGAVADDAPLVHAHLGTNVAARYEATVGDPDGAFAAAPHVFRERYSLERSASMPLETRGVVADWDLQEPLLRVWDSTQGPISIRNGLAHLFGLAQHQVQVQAPDVGGGFGCKIMQFYPEEILVPLAAMRLERPVKWIEDRREHFVATNHERLQLHDAEIAVDDAGRILALRDHFLHDNGAYTPYGIIVPLISACQLPGPYRVPSYHVEFRSVYTNTTAVSPYRGAGRPHAVFVMERLLDRVAAELGLDRAEVRRRNFIPPEAFPYVVGLTYQDGAPTRYDSGDYAAGLDRALALVEYERFTREVQPRLRAEGRYAGLGVACYVEGTGLGPYEGAHVRVEPSGKVFVATGLATQGQSHATTLGQIAADTLGVALEDVLVVTGDSRYFHYGSGTYASRAAVIAGNAVGLAARTVREQALALAADYLEADPADLVAEDGRVAVRGASRRGLSYAQLAQLANPLRYTYGSDAAEAVVPPPRPCNPGGSRPPGSGASPGLAEARPALAPGQQPGLEAIQYYSPPHATWASGVHVCVVEVDVETGEVRVLRYGVVHDCGTLINPMVVEGQIHGGVAQGIGGALYERLAYDAAGQLINSSFMDFLLPTANDVPTVEVAHLVTPSPLNPLGIKGLGEAGAIPGPALLASALEDALRPLGVRITRMPLSPSELAALIAASPTPQEMER